MHHELIDHFSTIRSPVHSLDPRAKIIPLFLLIVLAVQTPIQDYGRFVLYFLFLAVLIWQSRVPPGYLFRHCLLIIPFVFAVAVFLPFARGGTPLWVVHVPLVSLTVTREGILVFSSVLVRSFVSVLAMLILVSTTRFPDLLKGLELLKVPHLLIVMLSFLYRYIFVLIDEAQRMKRARDCRSFGNAGWRQVRVVGSMIGVLLIRTFERAERIYAAMSSRGFDGEIRTLTRLRLRTSDVMFIGLTCACLVVAWSVGRS